MGLVFRAVHQGRGATVALKVLKKQFSEDDVYRQRFIHEARAASAVQHKHLVRIIEAGEVDGRHYMAVSYVQGRSLREEIDAQGPLPLPRLAQITAEVAAGLDALHAAGLVHRDIKPSNIMISADGVAVLGDFGLARGPSYTVLTAPGRVMGTVDYLAPELIRDSPASPASDIYALGCTVFEALTGDPPFAERSAYQVAAAQLEDDPPDPCTARPDAPSSLSLAVLQALLKDPARRPRTATAYAHLIGVAVESAAV
jgi:serine/threonine-protein kinase